MATTFELTQDDKTFTFDLTGNVTQDGDDAGVWTTNSDSRIVVLPRAADATLPFDPDATAVPIATFDVKWVFNENNQLTIQSADGTEVVNLNTVGNIPFFTTRDAVLSVRPDISHAFGFQLRGEWDITESHDLSFTVGETTSVIDGTVQDSRSRFMYHFFDKENISINAVLGFVGSWESKTDDGIVTLDFVYSREDGSTDTFSLPGSLVVHRGSNQLLYQYDKEGRTYEVQLIGFLRIGDDFQITYTLDRQESRAGETQTASTTFTIETTYSNDHFSSDVKLVVKKNDGTPGTTFTIAGSMTASLGQTKLSVGFAFSQIRDGETITNTVAFNGSLEFRNGLIQWSFERNADTTTISISASDIRLGGARADARLNVIAENGQIQGIRALFGVSF